MHMLGTPGDMPHKPDYEDVAGDVLRYLVQRVHSLRNWGISDIIIDPGFGFGKSIQNNFDLLRKLEIFQILELPLMIGISRKSMIWKTLDVTPSDAQNGSTALHMIALQKGADILRVHDVRAACEAVRLYLAFAG
jgi:dihydropteroate synthase